MWDPGANSCIITNVDTSKLSLVSLFASDLTLLLIMLAGLLRLRNHGGTLEIGRLLWKQVGDIGSNRCDVAGSTDTFDILEGVIWFAIATIAELPQAVSLASFIVHFISLILFYTVAVPDFESER